MTKQKVLAAAKEIAKTLEAGIQRQIEGSFYFVFHDKYRNEIYVGYYLNGPKVPGKLYKNEKEQPMTDACTGNIQGWFQKLI